MLVLSTVTIPPNNHYPSPSSKSKPNLPLHKALNLDTGTQSPPCPYSQSHFQPRISKYQPHHQNANRLHRALSMTRSRSPVQPQPCVTRSKSQKSSIRWGHFHLITFNSSQHLATLTIPEINHANQRRLLPQKLIQIFNVHVKFIVSPLLREMPSQKTHEHAGSACFVHVFLWTLLDVIFHSDSDSSTVVIGHLTGDILENTSYVSRIPFVSDLRR
jgi:hypothetical protein